MYEKLNNDQCSPLYRNYSIDLHCKLAGFYMIRNNWLLMG